MMKVVFTKKLEHFKDFGDGRFCNSNAEHDF